MSSLESDSYNADELGQYRSLSSLAVVAFLLGIGSLLMFVSPLLVVVPMAAIATALLALKGIAGSDGGLIGAKLARIGLALAILFSAASFARVKVRDVLLQQQADQVARKWISLAADGQAELMLELMSPAAVEKLTPAVQTGQQMPYFGKILSSALIRVDPMMLRLSEIQPFRLDLGEVQMRAGAKAEAYLGYSASQGQSEPLDFYLVLKSGLSEGGNLWLVDSWGLK